MYTYSTKIHLRDTDATGILYFTELFRLALESFESFLFYKQYPLSKLFATPYRMPIVHAEADYFHPLCVSDEVEISLSLVKIGARSIHIQYTFYKKGSSLLVGKVDLIHAFIIEGENEASQIPSEIVSIFTTC